MLDCYYMNVSCDCSKEQSLALYEGLSKDRRNHVDKLKDKKLAAKQIIIGAFMQQCLSNYIAVDPSQIVFKYNGQGKPYIDADIQFNMSHSGDYAVLAVSDYPVGIDIEYLRHNRLPVAKRFFCEEEYEDILNAGGEAERDRRFLEYWTIKEACVKYLGKGLLVPLNSFKIVMGDTDAGGKDIYAEIKANPQLACGEGVKFEDVSIRTLYLNDDYNIAICFENRAMPYEMDVKKICLSEIL